jgi:hypothetical protein
MDEPRVDSHLAGGPRILGFENSPQRDRDGTVHGTGKAPLAARDPANTQWQSDFAVSCAKLGGLAHGQRIDLRRRHLIRGRQVSVDLKSFGRLMASQDWIPWFDDQLKKLGGNQL